MFNVALASISTKALIHNFTIAKKYSANASVVAVVKANAYGHRLQLVTPILENASVLAVSTIEDAIYLRAHYKKPILLIYGLNCQETLRQAQEAQCDVVVHNQHQLLLVKKSQLPTRVWLKIDSGMNRLGFSSLETKKILNDIASIKNIKLVAMLSHMANADIRDCPSIYQQIKCFTDVCPKGIDRSVANSALLLSKPQIVYEYSRPGIMLYGISPFSKPHPELMPAMKLEAPIVSIKPIQRGERTGYGGRWRAPTNTRLAVIAFGYSNGYPRHARDGTPILINGRIASLAGTVSMELLTVDIGDIPASVGDMATLWGDPKLPIEHVASNCDTIAYELLTALKPTLKFIQCS